MTFVGFRRWRRSLASGLQSAALMLLLVVAAASIWGWLEASDGSKESEVAAGLLAGSLIGLALVAIERRMHSDQEYRERMWLLASGDNLQGIDLSRTHIEGARAYKRDLEGAVFADANMRHVRFSSCRLKKTNFQNTDLSEALLDGSNLENAKLRNAELRGAILVNTNLYLADCVGANFTGARLEGAHLDFADLSDARFCGAIFVGRMANSPMLFGASLCNAYFYGADFRRAVLVASDRDPENDQQSVGADLTGAKANGETLWPDGFDPIGAGVKILPGSERDPPGPAWRDPGVEDVTGTAVPGSWRINEFSYTDPLDEVNIEDDREDLQDDWEEH